MNELVLIVKRYRWLQLLLVGWLAAAALPAQEGPLSLEFSFSNPGARSMGFGGAFVALSDDATAAFANPAGLVQLARRELSLEGRLWSYTTPFTEGGRLAGRPTGLGLDTVAGLRQSETSEDLAGVSFASYVYPKKRWAFALYRHQLADFESFSETQGFFAEDPLRLDDFRRSTRFAIVAHAAAFAFRVNERLSVGFTLSQFSSEVTVLTERFDTTVAQTVPDGPFGRNVYELPAREETVAATSDDGSVGVGLGALWRLSQSWSLGASFRQGPELQFEVREISGPAHSVLPAGTTTLIQQDTLQLPDVLALGLAYRSLNGRFTAGFEWDRVEYASIVDSLGESSSDANLDDGDELHLGFEVVFPGSTPLIALRAGAWLDPDHRVRFIGSTSALDRAIFRGGDDEIHFAFGVGLAFDDFQIDAAIDLSELVDTVSVSAIYSF